MAGDEEEAKEGGRVRPRQQLHGAHLQLELAEVEGGGGLEGEPLLPLRPENLLLTKGRLVEDVQDPILGNHHAFPLPTSAPVVSFVRTTVPEAQNSHSHFNLTVSFSHYVRYLFF